MEQKTALVVGGARQVIGGNLIEAPGKSGELGRQWGLSRRGRNGSRPRSAFAVERFHSAPEPRPNGTRPHRRHPHFLCRLPRPRAAWAGDGSAEPGNARQRHRRDRTRPASTLGMWARCRGTRSAGRADRCDSGEDDPPHMPPSSASISKVPRTSFSQTSLVLVCASSVRRAGVGLGNPLNLTCHGHRRLRLD